MAADARARQPGSRALRFLLVFCLGLVVLAFATSLWVERSPSGLLAGGEKRIALVDLRGEITASERFVEMLGDLDEDDGVRAVVVRVDSPGGAVAPSQEMYAAVRKLRERKLVIASLGSVAASGGYYVASAADAVVANPGTLTGSIGVIVQLANVEGLLDKIGIEADIVTAGSQKDMGSPFRALSAEDRAIFQRMADQIHAQFISAVAEGRGLSDETMEKVSTGRVFTGEEAQTIGLVDQLGGLEDAIRLAADRAGIEGEPVVERIRPSQVPWWLQALLSDDAMARSRGHGVVGLLEALSVLEGDASPVWLWRMPLVTEGLRW